jgi:hypothetical protein
MNQFPVLNDSGQKLADVCQDFYYEIKRGSGNYWMKNRDEYLPLSKADIKIHLADMGVRTSRQDGEWISQMDAALKHLQTKNCVKYAGSLAGYNAGRHTLLGNQILVTESAILPVPKRGDWPLIKSILSNLLGEEQLPYLLGWLKVSLQSRYDSHHRSAQAIVFAGPRGCGKSFVQNHIITPLFGGRAGKPYNWMAGNTNFNADLMEAEHLMIEDEVGDTTMKTRRQLGSQLKLVTVNEVQRCEGKYQQAIMLTPWWRLTLSINDEPENLSVLPPMDESLEDKIMLFLCEQKSMPHPTTTDRQRKEFREKVANELSHFAHYLTEDFSIPHGLECSRFGVKHYHHPELLARLNQLSPEMSLLELIDMNPDALFSEDTKKTEDGLRVFSGTAQEIERRLTGEYSQGRHIANKVFGRQTGNCGTYLGRIAKRLPNRVQRVPDTSKRQWIIIESPDVVGVGASPSTPSI